MKKNVHPNYVKSEVTCSCGGTFVTHSTQPVLKVEICSKCHPFYTGKQKLVDSGGRVQRFQKKYGLQVTGLEEKESTNKKLDDSNEKSDAKGSSK
ncbi:MAG TPA: 50S ribosomal protein L31 [Actinobacteria bacterium]|nr:50S ribosomal protein L31 [Actinomycetota bacterium]